MYKFAYEMVGVWKTPGAMFTRSDRLSFFFAGPTWKDLGQIGHFIIDGYSSLDASSDSRMANCSTRDNGQKLFSIIGTIPM